MIRASNIGHRMNNKPTTVLDPASGGSSTSCKSQTPCRCAAGFGRLAAFTLATVMTLPAATADESADVDLQPIDQIVVVANKTERSIREVAANVTVVSRDQLDIEMANSVADILRYAPGIDYEGAGTRFGTEGINIRGIGGNRVALLVDGVPLSDQFDIGSFSNATRDFVNAGFVQQLEVLHGPASALYGSAAIGGVVAMRTPLPVDLARDGQGGVLTANWRGADQSLNGTVLHAFSGESVGLLAGLSARGGEEIESAAAPSDLDQRDYDRRSAMLKLVADDPFGHTWQVGYYRQESDVRSSLSSMLGSGRFRSTTALVGDDNHRMDLFVAEYQFGSGDGLIDSGVVRGYYEVADIRQHTLDERGNARRPVSIDRLFVFEQDLAGVELNLQKEVVGDFVSHRLGFGLEYRERRTEEFRDGLETGIEDGARTKTLLGEVFPLRDFPISESADWGAYLEDAMSLADWTIIAALRADRYDLDAVSDRMYREDFPFADPVSLSESELSPKLGLIYRATPELDVYLQYSHGFRAPPYEDANIGLEIPVFNIRAIPNPDLKAESSDGFDLGVRWRGSNGDARLSVFRTDYDDFIETKVRLGVDPVSGRVLFQSQNVHEAAIEGVEAGWDVSLDRWLAGLSFDGSVYWARGENRDSGEPLNSVGPAQAVVGLRWSSPDGDWDASLRGTLTDRWSDRDETRGELFEPPGYAVFDVFLTHRMSESVTLRAGVLNVTDREYWVWSDVRGLAPDDPVIPYLARPGVSVTAGFDMRW